MMPATLADGARSTAEVEMLFARLEAMPGFLAQSFGTLEPAAATRRARDGGFAPVEHCWHLADLEREGYALRIDRLLSEVDPLLPDFEGDRIAEERAYLRLSLAAGLEAFRAARTATLAVLRGIREEQWQRAGCQVGVGPLTLCDVPAMMAKHDTAHRAEIEAWLREQG